MFRESIFAFLSSGSSADARHGAAANDSGPASLPMRAPLPPQLLVQDPENYAGVALTNEVTAGSLTLNVMRCRIGDVEAFAPQLQSGSCLPIGNSDFIRRCLAAAGIRPPNWTPYPRELASHMIQQPRRTVASRALGSPVPLFVKAVDGRPFRGFVLQNDRQAMDTTARIQFERLLDLPRSTPVWISEPVPLVSEWRYYVTGGEVIGYARNWPAELSDIASPPIEEVSAVVAASPKSMPYVLDFGVLPSLQCTLLTVRDAWGIDLLPFGLHVPPPLEFLRMLWARWQSIHAGDPAPDDLQQRIA